MGCCNSSPKAESDFDGAAGGAAGQKPVSMGNIEGGLEMANEGRVELALKNRPSLRELNKAPRKDPSTMLPVPLRQIAHGMRKP